MYFVPVRRLFKVLFTRSVSSKRERIPLTLHECLEAVPDSRQRFRRKWLLLCLVPFALFILYYHGNTASVYLQVHLNTSKYSERIVSHHKGYVAKKTLPQFDVNVQVKDLLSSIERKEEDNVTNQNPIVSEKIQDSNKSDDSFLASSNKNIIDGAKPYLNTVVDKYLRPCSPREKEQIPVNETKELFEIRRLQNTEIATDKSLENVELGGYYRPVKCRPRHKVAILVPYRNRLQNLEVFVFYMHPFLMRQQLEYRIFIIEQAGNNKFNRGKLFNIGFMEMWKYNDWHCVVLHDVDLLPMNDKILYTCPTFPRHMCGTVAEKEKLTSNQYHTLFGGVSALSVNQYKQINGFSNLYWGWGGEDNDMYWRILSARIPMVRYNKTVAKYTSLAHPTQPANRNRYRLLHTATERAKSDGLSSLIYKVIWTKYYHLYTHILADVNPSRENITNV